MKILLVTQWFDPEPTFKGLLFAQELKRNGHEVEVLTGFPNYPGGRIYDGYKISLYIKEEIDGITIHRVPLYPSHDSSAMKRIANYASFCFSALLGGLMKTRHIDVIYSYHPPLTTSLASVILGKLKRVPVVVDIQDLWPDTLSATGMINNEKVLSVVGKVCSLVYKMASRVIVLSPGFKSRLEERGVPAHKVQVIYNWCNEPALNNFEECAEKLPENGNINLLFAGNLGFAQGLPTITEACKLLQSRNVPVNVVLLGDGVAKQAAIEESEKAGLNNIHILPRVPMAQVGSLLSKADMLLVHLNDSELFRITIPSRTQANLAMGKPVIMGVKGDAADLVMKAGAGIVCEPGNSEELANAIQQMVSMSASERAEMGENARAFYYEELSLKHGVQRFIEVFEEVK
ncbi:glycosyltransferase family 4 protein [Enterovibrio norvegicus]|uniref:Glycosyltransferase involved in cell wall bisynthesis n=1 Tax=Enterovibrio norvegicus DSM 15893 TaxID=1121869 RepID=A0A1I5N9C1_9GAMM|nr:glycosyltransferase family 4 protein [Enterovibrio norvegicus]SFP18428.1 Glycosyltransferase involved in cell wall bisynthesis [Enterovibrio norvegicus DSM 15893]